MADRSKSKQSTSRPLQVIGWLGSSGHQTVINDAARGAQKTLRSEGRAPVQTEKKNQNKNRK